MTQNNSKVNHQRLNIDEGFNPDSKNPISNSLISSTMSNCLLENPKLVDLSLTSDHRITIKAGSKFYIPNGPGNFEEVVLESDYTSPAAVGTDYGSLRYVYYETDTKNFVVLSSGESGPENPTTIPSGNYMFYNTTTNKIYRYSNGTLLKEGKTSFPCALVRDGGIYQYSSIHQVFDSIGYMGKSIWFGKGLKMLFPNGRNEDNTLNSILHIKNNVQVISVLGRNNTFLVGLTGNEYGFARILKDHYTEGDFIPDKLDYLYHQFHYNPNTNYSYWIDAANLPLDWIKSVSCIILEYTEADQKITSFKVRSPYRPADFESVQDLKETSLNHSQITNCILENPKLVDLSLSDSVLTLKAGSTVIVPYGTSAPTLSIGDALNGGIISDISWDGSKLFYYVHYSTTKTVYYDTGTLSNISVYINGDGNININGHPSYSGTTPPTEGNLYNTSTNFVQRYIGGALAEDKISLTFALISTTQDVGVTSIDQIFKSIGYIGSNVWFGKGMKFLIPNGRNPDGTLKNIVKTTENILTRTAASSWAATTYTFMLDFTSSTIIMDYLQGYNCFEQRDEPSSYRYWFDTKNNLIFDVDGNIRHWTKPCSCYLTAGVISNFKDQETFRALDSNDTNFIAQQAMPSDRYIDLTLGATGTTYTAPADGYVLFNKNASAAGQYISLVVQTKDDLTKVQSLIWSSSSGTTSISAYVPVKSRDNFTIKYTAPGTTNHFRFTYAEGAK